MKIMIMRHEIIKGNLLTEFSEWIFFKMPQLFKRVIQGALIYYYSRSAYFLTNFLRLRFFFFRFFFFFVPGLRLPRLCSCRLFGCWFACKEELDGNFLLDNRGQCQTFDDDDSTLDSAWKIPRAKDIHTFKTLIWMPETKMEILYWCLLAKMDIKVLLNYFWIIHLLSLAKMDAKMLFLTLVFQLSVISPWWWRLFYRFDASLSLSTISTCWNSEAISSTIMPFFQHYSTEFNVKLTRNLR